MRCCDCSGNCESTTTIPFLDNRKAIVPPFSVKTPISFLSIFIFHGSSNIVAKIFCCARVNAPKVSADECRKFRRFIKEFKRFKRYQKSQGYKKKLFKLIEPLERLKLFNTLIYANSVL